MFDREGKYMTNHSNHDEQNRIDLKEQGSGSQVHKILKQIRTDNYFLVNVIEDNGCTSSIIR